MPLKLCGPGFTNTNRHHTVDGLAITVSPLRATLTDCRPSCRDAVLAAIDRLEQRTGATGFARRDVVAQVRATDTSLSGRPSTGVYAARFAVERGFGVADDLDRCEEQGVHVRPGSMAGLAEEAPFAYKDIDDVETCERADMGRRVARLLPLGVVKD